MAGWGEAEAGEMAWVERVGERGEGRIGGVAEAKDGLQCRGGRLGAGTRNRER